MKIALFVLLSTFFVFVDVTTARSIDKNDLQEQELILKARLVRSPPLRKGKRKKVKKITANCASHCRINANTRKYARKCDNKKRRNICQVCRLLSMCGKLATSPF